MWQKWYSALLLYRFTWNSTTDVVLQLIVPVIKGGIQITTLLLKWCQIAFQDVVVVCHHIQVPFCTHRSAICDSYLSPEPTEMKILAISVNSNRNAWGHLYVCQLALWSHSGLVVSVSVIPQVISGLADQLIYLVWFSILEQILDLSQFLLQLMDAGVSQITWSLSHLQDLGYKEADSIHVVFDLAHNVIPKLKAGVAGYTCGETSGKTTGTLITVLACCPLFARTCPCDTVTLTCHWPLTVTLTFCPNRKKARIKTEPRITQPSLLFK